ncbi:MAG: hypothetical protein C0609_08030 [Deltaproteobacteria bacterium]|nr:MAG: hypothetical protein C0609_08030 [Deltaproteobacteria bacterium]
MYNCVVLKGVIFVYFFKMRHFQALAILTVALMFCAAPILYASPNATKLQELSGELLHYDIKWSGMSAGEATMKVSAEGKNYRFSTTAKTGSKVSWLYPLNIRYESVVDGNNFTAVSYLKTGREGYGDPHERLVVFDHDEGVTRYIKDGKLRKTLEVSGDAYDPISVIYAIRVMTLPEVGGVIPIEVSDGKKLASGTVTVAGKERVKVPAGEFDAVRVTPKMEGVKGLFGDGSSMSVWLADDDERRILKIESSVAVGSFVAVLKEIIRPTPRPRDLQSANGDEAE